MSSAVIQLLVLAGVAVFLVLRLRSVLGTRDGFEKPPAQVSKENDAAARNRSEFEVIEGGPDRDITDHVADGTDAAKALGAMKLVERGFSVNEFLQGARGAYEMILMAFEKGDIDGLIPFLGQDVFESFAQVIDERRQKGLEIDATFIGVRELTLVDAAFDRDTGEAEITVRFVGELTSVVRDKDRAIVEGDPNEIKRQRDTWTFSRVVGSDDPNWKLVATGE